MEEQEGLERGREWGWAPDRLLISLSPGPPPTTATWSNGGQVTEAAEPGAPPAGGRAWLAAP